MLPLPHIAFGLVVVSLAGLTMGLTGFGFALMATPLLLLVLPPTVVVPLLTLQSTLNNVVILWESRRWVDLRRIWPLMLAGIVGVPFGAYLLVAWDVNTLKAFIGAAAALSALALLFGFKRHIVRERLAALPVGLASGLLNGSTGMAGAPVILFFTNQGIEKRAFRANLTAYFGLLNVVTLTTYAANGLITRPVAACAGLLLPGLVVGLVVGTRLVPRVNEQRFRQITLAVVGASGLLGVATGLRLF
ncbi:MAG TPA: sulfite exporter TauE/SafE family protein [Anaerolineae bacterium]|nr:sulfite exporter TauE/SafE family protein [Anaerolineae bacterium]HOQ99929.1 sulfite exporter TauE/SafE family protein [Anaerolineae bacterium]HPL26842.1 sulfite exporter TauE/SafE family protein [Anaerolineae bacterium]